jgi:hypothetical protein
MSEPTFQIDQVLHGYRNGHRLLAASLDLDERSAAAMLGLSDLLVEAAEVSTYLVGYALRSANRYVLARTWRAPEMPRPGCVWTHSLLLSYSDLARIENPNQLLPLFRRPTGEGWTPYTEAIVERRHPETGPPDVLDQGRLASAMAAFYAQADSRVDLPGTGVDDEQMSLALWRQMWPRLRRGLFFCSAASGRISHVDSDCSLIFHPGAEGDQLARMVSSARPPSAALRLLIDDAPKRELTPLRRFLARYAPEFPDQRLAALPLSSVFQQLATATTPAKLANAVAAIDELLGPENARLLKVDLLLGRFREPMPEGVQAADDFRAAVIGLKDHPSPLDDEVLAGRMSALLAAGRLDLEGLFAGTAQSAPASLGGRAFEVMATQLPIAWTRLQTLDEDVRIRAAERNPDLWGRSDFWPHEPDHRRLMMEAALNSGLPPDDILSTLDHAIDGQEAQAMLAAGGEATAVELADLWASGALGSVSVGFLESLLADPVAGRRVAVACADKIERLEQLAEVNPEALERVLSTADLAYWVDGWTSSTARPPGVSALCLAAGLSADPPISSELIRFGLDPVFAAVRHGALPDRVWRYLDERFAGARYESPRDLDERIVRRLAERFVAREDPDPWILRVSKEPETAIEVLRAIEARFMGHYLLNSLYSIAKKRGSGVAKRALKILEQALWSTTH